MGHAPARGRVLAALGLAADLAHDLGDLAELANNHCPRPDYQRHVFFRSIGMGLQDIAIAHALLQRVQQAA